MAITSRERVRALLVNEINDRMGKADAPWPETRERWHEEGMPADVHASDYFRMDVRMMVKILPTFQLAESVVEETDEWQIVSDADGNVIKYWKGKSGVPMPIKPGIAGRPDWEGLKDRLVANEDRFAFGYYGNYFFEYQKGPLSSIARAYKSNENVQDTFTLLEVLDPYEFAMAKMGDENILMKMVMEPDLLHDMFDAYAKMVVASGDMLFSAGVNPDGVFLGGDISYKNGMLFSPEMHREIVFPYLKRIIDFFKGEHGLRIVYHCDGNPTQAIPNLVDAGIDCLEPLEVNAGMDVRKLAKDWGHRLSFMGNISTQTMSGSKDKLRAEVMSKMDACREARCGYIVHSDHSVPVTVPLENMQLVVELVDKYGAY